MTEIKGRWAPDERSATGPDLVITAVSPLLQSPIMITLETNYPSREYTVIKLSLPVKLPKTTQDAHETPSSHPSTLGKTATQLSLPSTRIVPQPHHIQHTDTDPYCQTLKQLIRIPERPRPLNTTIGERKTKRRMVWMWIHEGGVIPVMDMVWKRSWRAS